MNPAAPIRNRQWRRLFDNHCGKCHTGANASFGQIRSPCRFARCGALSGLHYRPVYESLLASVLGFSPCIPFFGPAIAIRHGAAAARSKHHGKRSRTLLLQVHTRAALFALGLAGTFLVWPFTGLPSIQHQFRHADPRPSVGGFGAVLFFHKFCAVVLTITFLHSPGRYRLRIVAKRDFVCCGTNSMCRV